MYVYIQTFASVHYPNSTPQLKKNTYLMVRYLSYGTLCKDQKVKFKPFCFIVIFYIQFQYNTMKFRSSQKEGKRIFSIQFLISYSTHKSRKCKQNQLYFEIFLFNSKTVSYLRQKIVFFSICLDSEGSCRDFTIFSHGGHFCILSRKQNVARFIIKGMIFIYEYMNM